MLPRRNVLCQIMDRKYTQKDSCRIFLYALLILIAPFLLEPVLATETTYITAASRGYLNAENGSPYFECSRSEPELDAEVEIDRYVYTLNSPTSQSPPPRTPTEIQGVGIPTSSTIYKSDLDINYNRAFGVFYCASRYDNGWTVVPVTFLRSDAHFIPLGGRFTKTVSTGDNLVSIDFQNVVFLNRDHNWRHNGTLNPLDMILTKTYNTSYFIPGAVQSSDGGVYELHYANNRGTGRAGLMRLIVRECPAGRHESPTGCVHTCPSCYNGGVCDDKTGECICPPGFQGDHCETGCGGNRYGRNCEYRCDYDNDDETACVGLRVCVPDPFGCSCTPGYKELNCSTACIPPEFGASCTEICHCASGECDRFTGVCTGSSTRCLSGWKGVNCQECSNGQFGPDCNGDIVTSYIKTNEGVSPKVTCSFQGGRFISTANPVVTLYRKSGSEEFHQSDITLLEARIRQLYTFNVTHSQLGEIFYCSMVDVNTYQSVEIVGEGLFVLPRLPSDPIIKEATNESVTLTWEAWDDTTSEGDPPIVGYDMYYRVDDQDNSVQEFASRSSAVSHFIPQLNPDTYYRFGVRAVRPGEGGEGPWREIRARTLCSPPEGPSCVIVTNSTMPGEIIVFVVIPEKGSNCREGFTGVRMYSSQLDETSGNSTTETSVSVDYDIQDYNMYTLTGLESSSIYVISVSLMNRGSESRRSEEHIAYTRREEPCSCEISWVLAGFSFFINIVCGIIMIISCRSQHNCVSNGTKEGETSTSGPAKQSTNLNNTAFQSYEMTNAPLTDACVYQNVEAEGSHNVNGSGENEEHMYQDLNEYPTKRKDENPLLYQALNQPQPRSGAVICETMK